MYNYLIAALGLLTALTVYHVVSTFLSGRYHARRARELGCKPPFRRQHRLPFGIDTVKRILDADKKQVVPTEFERIYNELGQHHTWSQNMLGTWHFVTVEPKNIQAILATQFNDFEIGPTRRGNFFPLLGNGIFTSDGKAW